MEIQHKVSLSNMIKDYLASTDRADTRIYIDRLGTWTSEPRPECFSIRLDTIPVISDEPLQRRISAGFSWLETNVLPEFFGLRVDVISAKKWIVEVFYSDGCILRSLRIGAPADALNSVMRDSAKKDGMFGGEITRVVIFPATEKELADFQGYEGLSSLGEVKAVILDLRKETSK